MDTTLKVKTFMSLVFACVGCLWTTTSQDTIEASRLGVSHLGTFEGSTTFTTSSSNGINPGLFIEVVDDEGNLKQYSSEDGIITIPDTKEGAYVTQAKLLGKTKYRDQDTNELLDVWEEGRNLTLESVQMPVLTTTGSNMANPTDIKVIGCKSYDVDSDGIVNVVGDTTGYWARSYIRYTHHLKGNTTYYIYCDGDSTGTIKAEGWVDNINSGKISWNNFYKYTPETDVLYEAKIFLNTDASPFTCSKIRIGIFESTTEPSSFEPYKSNILSTSEDVTLRGIGDVKDELDLVSGELLSNFDEITFDGSENWILNSTSDTVMRFWLNTEKTSNALHKYEAIQKSDKFHTKVGSPVVSNEDSYMVPHPSGSCWIVINKNKLISEDLLGFKNWLKSNKPTFIYQTNPTIKTVDLKGTHQFPLLNKSFVQLKGEATPVITSITVPSESLPFTLDPNQETGQQFIAPEFEVTNDSNAPLSLTLKTFEQMTDVLNDVLPTKYDSWEGLSKEESKDIALGLMAKSSTDWLTYTKEPHYVSETMNKLLGTIKPNGTVGFEFMAHHGQAFSEVLNPRYKLTFVFDLLN